MAAEESKQWERRFLELANRADSGFWTETGFLNLAEQEPLAGLRLPVPVALYGGYPEAERKLAAFGSEALCGYPYAPPIVCLKLEPAAPSKFAEPLTHRDFLGALMGLGIRREVTGDIVLRENAGYLFCLASMAPFIQENLGQVKRTKIRCGLAQLPEAPEAALPPRQILVPSERLDALVAAAYNLPRSEGKALVEQGKVYVDSRLTTNASAAPRPGSAVSVRGLGRFTYGGVSRETKKSRLCVTIQVPQP